MKEAIAWNMAMAAPHFVWLRTDRSVVNFVMWDHFNNIDPRKNGGWKKFSL
jgi:hypothetical protein